MPPSPTEKFLAAIGDEQPDICGLSAMLTTSMLAMAQSVEAIKREFSEQIVIIGSAPVSGKFAAENGADAYGKNAMYAVEIAYDLIS